MFKHALSLVVATLAVTLLMLPASAAEKTHEGSVVSVSEGKLVMVDKDGKNEHSHVIAVTTKVTIDGKAAKLADLKKGDKIKVTQDEGKVTAVACTRAP